MLGGGIAQLYEKIIAISCLRSCSALTHKCSSAWSVEDEENQELFTDDLLHAWVETSTWAMKSARCSGSPPQPSHPQFQLQLCRWECSGLPGDCGVMAGLSNSCLSFSLCISSSVAQSVQVMLLVINSLRLKGKVNKTVRTGKMKGLHSGHVGKWVSPAKQRFLRG